MFSINDSTEQWDDILHNKNVTSLISLFITKLFSVQYTNYSSYSVVDEYIVQP